MNDIPLEMARTAIDAVRAGRRRPPVVQSFFDVATETASHVVHDPITRNAAVIDSVLDFDAATGRTGVSAADRIVRYVRDENLTVSWLLETHVHADHLSAAPYLQQTLGGKLAIGRGILCVQDIFGKLFNIGTAFERDGADFDDLFVDGDRFSMGELECVVLHVPGHTPADLAYVIGDLVFAGDTLFMPDYGTARADFPGGSARDLFRSIRRLLSLPAEARLLLCHDYKAAGRDQYVWETTIGAQRAGNIHVHDGVEEDAFVAMRDARDATLPMPRLIIPAIQVNMRGGRLPEPEDNGVRYLKLPLNSF